MTVTEVLVSDVNKTVKLKDHRQRIPRFVIRRYLEKSIQKKLFGHLQSLQINTIFQEKNDYKLNFRKFTVTVYLWSWRHWCQLVNKHRHTARYQPATTGTETDKTVGGKMQWTQAAVRQLSPTNTANSPRPLTALSSVVWKTEKWNVFTTTTIIITTERNTVNHYDKIYGVFETLTNK